MSDDSNDADLALIAALERGDQMALTELYDRYAPLMNAIAVRLLDSRRDAEDLVHDVFIEAWQKIGSYDPGRGTVRAWLLLRLRSRASDRRRSLATARAKAVLLTQDEEHSPDTIRLAEQAQAQDLLARLDKEPRDMLEMAYFEGLTSRDIAERLDVPIGTVKSKLSRAMASLRAHVNQTAEAT